MAKYITQNTTAIAYEEHRFYSDRERGGKKQCLNNERRINDKKSDNGVSAKRPSRRRGKRNNINAITRGLLLKG